MGCRPGIQKLALKVGVEAFIKLIGFSYTSSWGQGIVHIEETDGVLERTALESRIRWLLCHDFLEVKKSKSLRRPSLRRFLLMNERVSVERDVCFLPYISGSWI